MTMQRNVWLVSDGRSGSTWFSSLLNHGRQFAEYFEPMHAAFNPLLSGESIIPCFEPGKAPEKYVRLYADIFGKRFSDSRSGPTNADASLVLAKDIHALLCAKAISEHFQDVDVVCLVRNPIEVALSKIRLDDWLWIRCPIELLENSSMVEILPRSLFQYALRATTQFERYVAIWTVLHFVVRSQFKPNEILFVKYVDDIERIKQVVAFVLERAAGQRVQEADFRSAYFRRSATDVPLEAGKDRYAPSTAEFSYAAKIVQAAGLADLAQF